MILPLRLYTLAWVPALDPETGFRGELFAAFLERVLSKIDPEKGLLVQRCLHVWAIDWAVGTKESSLACP